METSPQFPRAVFPLGLPPGWVGVEKQYLHGKLAGQTYARYSREDGKHPHTPSVTAAIKHHAADLGIDPQPLLDEWEHKKREEAKKQAVEREQAREKAEAAAKERREASLGAFRNKFGALDSVTVQALPGWHVRYDYMEGSSQVHAEYKDPEGQVWRVIKDIEVHFGSRMFGGEDISAMILHARRHANPIGCQEEKAAALKKLKCAHKLEGDRCEPEPYITPKKQRLLFSYVGASPGQASIKIEESGQVKHAQLSSRKMVVQEPSSTPCVSTSLVDAPVVKTRSSIETSQCSAPVCPVREAPVEELVTPAKAKLETLDEVQSPSKRAKLSFCKVPVQEPSTARCVSTARSATTPVAAPVMKGESLVAETIRLDSRAHCKNHPRSAPSGRCQKRVSSARTSQSSAPTCLAPAEDVVTPIKAKVEKSAEVLSTSKQAQRSSRKILVQEPSNSICVKTPVAAPDLKMERLVDDTSRLDAPATVRKRARSAPAGRGGKMAACHVASQSSAVSSSVTSQCIPKVHVPPELHSYLMSLSVDQRRQVLGQNL
uniref:Uncharacterized protein n=1 Tax=Noctiluca scintillans TaxID=2966 RepID=A0A7S1AMW9_NOCSC|mmetsp:Transcript_52622/g.140257  ORF Transcript_52622/g.140257 Transcript_52622/m.140257 type:complete len:545 (+) Transcript_52622:58-1692(+)